MPRGRALDWARDALREHLARPCDIAWLAAFRVLYGVSMAISAQRFIANDWVHRLFVEPRFHFKYLGFSWVEPLSEPYMHAFFYWLMALGACIAVGFLTRASLALFVLSFGYLQLIDVTTYLNHYYLATLLGLLLLVVPCGRAWSIDARLFPTLRRSTVPRAVFSLFRFQVGVVYVFAGLAKLSSDWLLHGQPLRIWLGARTDMPFIGPFFSWEHSALVMSWAGFLFDSTVVGFLLFRRTRLPAYLVLVGFHLATGLMFPIGMFPVIMTTSALVFFAPDWPRRVLRRVAPQLIGESSESETVAMRGNALRRWLPIGLCYCMVQVLVPLRFAVYGGDVRWHEQGMRFSWRVMVREKNGSVVYDVTSPALARTWQLGPSSYLTPLQEREMSGQPDLILQLAHHIEQDFQRRGVHDVQVRAETLVSLNGRPAVALIDPNVDLARISDGLGKASWILKAPSEAPPHLRPVESQSTSKPGR